MEYRVIINIDGGTAATSISPISPHYPTVDAKIRPIQVLGGTPPYGGRK